MADRNAEKQAERSGVHGASRKAERNGAERYPQKPVFLQRYQTVPLERRTWNEVPLGPRLQAFRSTSLIWGPQNGTPLIDLYPYRCPISQDSASARKASAEPSAVLRAPDAALQGGH